MSRQVLVIKQSVSGHHREVSHSKYWYSISATKLMRQAGHDNWVRALAFHPGGKFLLSSSDDKTIRCWDLEQQGRCVRTIDDAHSHFISCLRWAPNLAQKSAVPEQNGMKGKDDAAKVNGIRCVIASGSVDMDVKIWMP
jgi:platelet-activating factor acetylhydrolase IB subunit alpha